MTAPSRRYLTGVWPCMVPVTDNPWDEDSGNADQDPRDDDQDDE